jgi:formamidopyrimidine-DNA glycosylase
MPELPEVEVTRRTLADRLQGLPVRAVRVYQTQLRWPVPRNLSRLLSGHTLAQIDRRGKYLLWRFDHGVLISHFGMTGSWRIHAGPSMPVRGPHDHAELIFDSVLARLTDPRRFGALLWHRASQGDVSRHPLLAGLGVEPLDSRFDGELLHRQMHGRSAAIKQVLLAGDVVVGVGNIYASESLFRAGINPRLPAKKLGRLRCARLADAVREVLREAIEVGGSTLRDFTDAEGAEGSYALMARVYGRDGHNCPVCARPIRRIVQGQRATYLCARCQRR